MTTEDFPAIFTEGWALPKRDRFLDHFMPITHRDATFTQPGFPVAVGHDQIQRMFRRLFTLLPDLNTVPTRSATCGDAVFIESECMATLGSAMVAFSVCDRCCSRRWAAQPAGCVWFGRGPVVLILHPGMETGNRYGKVAAILSKRFRVIRIQRRQYRVDLKREPRVGSLGSTNTTGLPRDRNRAFLTAQLVRLCEHQQALIEAIAADDISGMESANWNFHREINLHAGAPRPLLKGTLRLIRQHFYALAKAWAPVAQTGHRAILAAFEANAPEAARLAGLDHLINPWLPLLDRC